MPPNIHLSQVGYLCDARKRLALSGLEAAEFEIQDLTRHLRDAIGKHENWQTVFRGQLQPHQGGMGRYFIGDFTEIRRPGVYRAVLPGKTGHSYPFVISDAAFAVLPPLFLDYVHNQRCGPFENEWRGPCHLDDAVRSDDGRPIDVVGGWHDAGDLRKWMATTPLPARGFIHIREKLNPSRNNWREEPYQNDLLSELAWGVRFILKMQDPRTGMVYEDVGGGGDRRRLPISQWWLDNHAGCYADNEENHFTDNRPRSGDERRVRVQYNPIVQYTNLTILMEAARVFERFDPELVQRCRRAGLRCWRFMDGKAADDYHTWTSTLSWRLLAALPLVKAKAIAPQVLAEIATLLFALQDGARGFWHMDTKRREPYRGIVHAAQPVIALASLIEWNRTGKLADKAVKALRACWKQFICPMLQTNPFGLMPYALFVKEPTQGDVYHDFGNGMKYRFFMPDHSDQKINHGLASHWTSWAHGLALAGTVLNERAWIEAAWDQLHWLMGNNPCNTSLITGVGYSNAMPYSRFFGNLPGGFCLGPRGDAKDRIFIESEGWPDWSSGEYWMVPLANSLMALAYLLPVQVERTRKLGRN